MKTIREFFRRLFCIHDWAIQDSARYAVIGRRSGEMVQVGEVTLTILTCNKCGKDTIIPSDRTSTSPLP